MPGKPVSDQFANIAYLAVVESAANTLTFAQLAIAGALMSEKFALIIHKAEVHLSTTSTNYLVDENDSITIGLTLSDRVSDLAALSEPEILFFASWGLAKFGVSASGFPTFRPMVRDFTDLPGGGLLVPGDRLYMGIKGASLANPASAAMRLYYTMKPLTVADYWELIEARRVMTT